MCSAWRPSLHMQVLCGNKGNDVLSVCARACTAFPNQASSPLARSTSQYDLTPFWACGAILWALDPCHGQFCTMVNTSSNRPHRHDLPSWRPCTYASCPRLPVCSVCDPLGQTDHIQRYDGQPSSESAASPASTCRPGSRAQASYSGFFSFQYLRPMWPHR